MCNAGERERELEAGWCVLERTDECSHKTASYST